MVPTIHDAEHRYRLLLLEYYRKHGVAGDEGGNFDMYAAFFDGAAHVLNLTQEEIKKAAEWVLVQIAIDRGEVPVPTFTVRALPIKTFMRSRKEFEESARGVEIVCSENWDAVDTLSSEAPVRLKLVAAFQYMRSSLGASLHDLEHHVGLSASQLNSIFRDTVKMHPKQFQVACRVEMVKRLVLEGMKISQVATVSGFKNQPAMHHAFKRATGRTIGEWRKVMLGGFATTAGQ